MARRSKPLVVEHLENISRKALEKYQPLIKEYVKGKKGVYALYRGDKLKYVGLATNLRSRLHTHLRDRHSQSWDKFSVYLTIDDEHLRELEALVIRIAAPKENRQKAKFSISENLLLRFRKDVSRYQQKELREILGIDEKGGEEQGPRAKKKSTRAKYSANRKKRGRQAALAPYVING
jgi:predicted GIY-YIG superfamily endonuclease